MTRLTVSRVQAILSIIVVTAFVSVSTIVALTPVLGGYPPPEYTEHLRTFASLYSGVVGLILGYYFGQKGSEPREP
jgi:hypothetical protein